MWEDKTPSSSSSSSLSLSLHLSTPYHTMKRGRPKRKVPKKASARGKKRKNEEESDLDDDDYDLYLPTSNLDNAEISDSDLEYLKEKACKDVKGKGKVVIEAGSDSEKEAPRVSLRRKKKKRRRKRGTDPDQILWWQKWEEENEKWLDANENKDFDLDGNEKANMVETAEPSRELILPLFRFQKEWLAWALKQEASEIRGGVLADEMGMGKTIQAISLVLTARATRLTVSSDSTQPSCSSSLPLPKVKCTLVICPMIAISQWVSEIAKYTAEGSTKVLVYHGPNRPRDIELFTEYDFVLTTYSTVEADYRINVMPPKERCEWCGKLFYPKKMAIHLKYFCGPDAVKTSKQSKQVKKKVRHTSKGTNLEKDSAFVDDSATEIKGSKGKGAIKTKKQAKQQKKVNIKSPTYNPKVPGEESSTRKSVLHLVKWERIILDEAHYIKDRRCNTAKAVFALESSYKWGLSGTPLQNRVGELYSLVRFLQISPYSYYFCKDCDCKTLDYSSTRDCPHCVHSANRHFCWWNKYVANPIVERGYVEEGRRAMILLKHKLLQSVVLRRTKKGRAADLSLPPRIVSVRRDTMDTKEEDFYEALYTQSQAQFNTYIDTGTVMNNYAHIFDLLTRLRQAVDHPYLVIYSKTAALARGNETVNVEQDCGICHDPAEDPQVTTCTHVFCKACLMDYTKCAEHASCPTCLKPLTVDLRPTENQGQQRTTKRSILNQIRLEDFQTSTKIEALREEIRFMVENDGSAKGIVFSQFTSFLELINYSLQKSGVKCVQLDGSMSITGRDRAIKTFIDDPDCKIFLMSLKAGGVALNLTVASHVFLMDPWWNPAVEQQAQDRIHRIGQFKPIRIVRFVIENTIEERILRLQDKKQLVFEGTVGGSAQALVKLTVEDLRFLFLM
ncbi:helicase protein with RING/U-box domain-containing protein [Tasmannia lanceolata]|uniref:helicase protein with RING/U-box domain-containing protein n=1 Tax=Tasmannia lanceolata TaxID=3420 RepID=UPI00406444FD